MQNFADKSLIIFDLDGTLAESKQVMGSEMTGLLARLLEHKKVAVISGGSFEQFKKQFLPALEKIGGDATSQTLESGGSQDSRFRGNDKDQAPSLHFSNLFLLPTSGSAMYIYKKNVWKLEYSHHLSTTEKEKIYAAFKEALEKSGEKLPEKHYGDVAEDRGDQITFSADGQEAPIEVKAQWDPTEKKRLHIVSSLKPLLPDFSIGIGGMTSIDVTKKGIDKAFGVRKICEYTKIPIEKAVYVGDALFEGGNDYAARASGVECVEVKNVEETKRLIEKIIK
jgi:HAD superfamily hydrolase (TIGR01484 family)